MATLLTVLAIAFTPYAAAHLIRPWYTRWGAAREESTQPIPGLETLEDSRITSTHAIAIQAPPSQIWPWLVQMGSGRGDCHSYAWLENLVGCRIRIANRILPELAQNQSSCHEPPSGIVGLLTSAYIDFSGFSPSSA